MNSEAPTQSNDQTQKALTLVHAAIESLNAIKVEKLYVFMLGAEATALTWARLHLSKAVNELNLIERADP